MARTGNSTKTAPAPDRAMFSNDKDFQDASRIYQGNPALYNAATAGNYSGLSGMGVMVGDLFGKQSWANAVRHYQPTPAPAPTSAPVAMAPPSVPVDRRPVAPVDRRPVLSSGTSSPWFNPQTAAPKKQQLPDDVNAWTLGMNPGPFGGK